MTAEPIFNVADYGNDIQTALNAASDDQTFLLRGGTVFIPRGQYVVDNPLLVKGGRLILRGENLDVSIEPSNSDLPVVKLQGDNSAGFGIHDFKAERFQINGSPGSITGCVGISCIGESGYYPSGLRFEDVFINECEIGAVFDHANFPMFTRCGVFGSVSHGMTFREVSQISFYHCFIQVNGGKGLQVEDALGFYFQGPGLQNNTDWQLHLLNSWSCHLDRSDIEEFVNGVLIQGCRGVGITYNVFLPKPNIAGANVTAILIKADPSSLAVQGPGASGIAIIGNTIFGSGDAGTNNGRVTGVKVEKGSTFDLFLAANGPGSRAPARFVRMYDLPIGRDAENMNITVLGAHTGDGFEAGRTQRGFRPGNIPDDELAQNIPENHGLIAWHEGTERLMVNIRGNWRRL